MWYIGDKKVEAIEDLPGSEHLYGFIYKITNLKNDRYYIGKKVFYFERTKHFGKKELKQVTDKRKKTYKKVRSESNWKEYWGSVDSESDFKEDLLHFGIENFKREIIGLANTKRELTYLELEVLVQHNVLRDHFAYNRNILGKWFPKGLSS